MSNDFLPPNPDVGKRILFLMQMQGGLIRTPDLAVQIAEALCKAHYGAAELARQRPLVAVDKDTFWRVEGAFNRDGEVPGVGHFFLSIEKYDGRVTDIGIWFRNPEGEEILKEVIAAKSPEEKNALVMKRLAARQAKEDKKN